MMVLLLSTFIFIVITSSGFDSMIEKSDLRVWSVMVCEGDGGDGGGACHSLEWTLLIC